MFDDQQGGLKLKIAALKVTKKTATRDAEVRKVSPVVTKFYGKEKPKVEKTSAQVNVVMRPDAKTNSTRKLEVRKKPLEVRDGTKTRGVGRAQNKDKVLYMHILLMICCINLYWPCFNTGHSLAGQELYFFSANAITLPIEMWPPCLSYL
jgi:hypothetical protein